MAVFERFPEHIVLTVQQGGVHQQTHAEVWRQVRLDEVYLNYV